MFAFADMMHLFADEFAGLGGERFAFAFIFAGAFKRFFFRHTKNTRWRGDSDSRKYLS